MYKASGRENMALIKCPECSREVSDQADSCPHCGFPIKKQSHKDIENILSNASLSRPVKIREIQKVKQWDLKEIIDTVKEYEESHPKSIKPKASTGPVCPKCGSTEFTPVRRKWSLMTGILTNKVDLICNKCGTKVKTQ